MIKQILKTSIIALVLLMSVNLSAQKFGHIDSAKLLSEMPAMKQAETSLETFSKKLDEQYKTKLTTIETKYKTFAEQVQNGLLSPQDQATKEQELQTLQTEIQQFEVEAQQKIAKKRDELIAPIIDTAKNAIDAVASENGISYVFDLSTGTVLYSPPSDDITSKVKAKLGM